MPLSTPPLLHLVCGLPGSGKTTLARRIEASSGAIRFCPDEWIRRIWPLETAATEGNARRDAIEQLQWRIAKDFLKTGKDVIIEWGTWGRGERALLRDEAHALEAQAKLYYLDFPKVVLKERILLRNENPGNDDFRMPEETLDAVLEDNFNLFQAPDSEEVESFDFYLLIKSELPPSF